MRQPQHETRVIALPDGRDLAWLEFGDPNGAAVFAFHGSPGRGSMFAPHNDEFRAAHLRVVAPDRPGYGHSTFFAARTYASWAADVAFLGDYLELDRFGVFGVSSGGPNAAVCARFLGERLTGCAIVSSPAPFDPTIPDDDTMLPMNRLGRRMVRRVPRFTGWMATTMAQITHLTPERMYEYAVRDLPEPDLAIARRPEVRADMIADFARAQPPTMMRTAVQDFTLEMHDWGFALGDIAMPVDVWHGDDDRNVPVRNGVRIAQAIPNATFHRLPNTGHWLFFTRAVEIMRAVAPH